MEKPEKFNLLAKLSQEDLQTLTELNAARESLLNKKKASEHSQSTEWRYKDAYTLKELDRKICRVVSYLGIHKEQITEILELIPKKAYEVIPDDDTIEATLTEIYEFTYKYQLLRQEMQRGDYGVPTNLGDRANVAFEQIKEQLTARLNGTYINLLYVFTQWVGQHDWKNEYDDEMEAYENYADVEFVHNILLKFVSGKISLQEFADWTSSEFIADLSAEVLGAVQKNPSAYGLSPEEAQNITFQGLIDSFGIEDLVGEINTAFINNNYALTAAGKQALANNENFQQDIRDGIESDEFRQVSYVLDKLQTQWDSAALDEKIVLFQEALTTAHHSGEMAQYLLGGDYQYDSAATQEFFNNLSAGPQVPEWEADVAKLIGYDPGSRLVPTQTQHQPQAFSLSANVAPQTLEDLYEWIYKYQMLLAEQKTGDMGMPKQLPFKAEYMISDLESRLRGELPRVNQEILDGITRWLEQEQQFWFDHLVENYYYPTEFAQLVEMGDPESPNYTDSDAWWSANTELQQSMVVVTAQLIGKVAKVLAEELDYTTLFGMIDSYMLSGSIYIRYAMEELPEGRSFAEEDERAELFKVLHKHMDSGVRQRAIREYLESTGLADHFIDYALPDTFSADSAIMLEAIYAHYDLVVDAVPDLAAIVSLENIEDVQKLKSTQVPIAEDVSFRLQQANSSGNIDDLIIAFQAGVTLSHHNGPIAEYWLQMNALDITSLLNQLSAGGQVGRWNLDLQKVLGYELGQYADPGDVWVDPSRQAKTAQADSQFSYLLTNEINKYTTFEDLKHAWTIDLKHGMYWHVTEDPDFTIDLSKGPRDMSSGAGGGRSSDVGKLMVTSHLENWNAYYNPGDEAEEGQSPVSRPYASLIDLSALAPEEYRQINRGFGNEFMVDNPCAAVVLGVFSIDQALQIDEAYDRILPQSAEALKEMWDATQEGLSKQSFISNPIIYLRDYLTMSNADRGRDLAHTYPDFFARFAVGEEWTDPDVTIEALEDDFDAIENLIEKLDDQKLEAFYTHATYTSWLASDTMAPPYLSMEYQDLIQNQWMIHFTDDADGVASDGFTIGTEGYEGLALSTYLSDEQKPGGFNFAYLLSDYQAHGRGRVSEGWKYGKECVIFRASGIQVWHIGDQEPQVIFWGESATDIVPIKYIEGGYSEGEGWCAGYHLDDLDHSSYCNEDLDTVVTWVLNNYDQYKRLLTAKTAQQRPMNCKRIVYHGSDADDIEALEWRTPSYEGGLGSGVYVTENYDTAAFYGDNVYALCLDASDDEILWLDAANQYQFEGLEGTSILIGESVPPFMFMIGDKKYAVGIDKIPDDKDRLLETLNEYLPEELVKDIMKQADSYDGIDTEAAAYDNEIDLFVESDDEYNALEARVQEALDAYHSQTPDDLILIDLDDIGAIAEEHGYKGVFFERWNPSAPDEILVFNSENLTMLGPVDAPIEKEAQQANSLGNTKFEDIFDSKPKDQFDTEHFLTGLLDDYAIALGYNPYDVPQDIVNEDNPEFREWAAKRLEGTFYSAMERIENRMTPSRTIDVYRQMRVPANWMEHLAEHGKHLGIYWSWDPDAASVAWSSEREGWDETTALIHGEVEENAVDWPATLGANINPGIGADEKEITLHDGVPVFVKSIVLDGVEQDLSLLRGHRFVAQQESDYLYHGTSLVQYERIKENDFIVENLYVGDSKENITAHYADRQAEEDDSYPVTLVFDRAKLEKMLEEDYHEHVGDERVPQEGQFYFSGNAKPALVDVLLYDYDSDEEKSIFNKVAQQQDHPTKMTLEELKDFKIPGEGDTSRDPSSIEELRTEGGLLSDYTNDDWSVREWLGAHSEYKPDDFEEQVQAVYNNTPIKVYRATDSEDVIFPGAYVTNSRKYAELHAESTISGEHLWEPKEAKILEARALPSELIAVNPLEFWYAPESVEDWYKKVTAQQDVSNYLYHVTYLRNLESIQQNGLQPGADPTFTNMQPHSSNRIFLGEEDGVYFWNSRYEDWANAASDNPIANGLIPITLKITLSQGIEESLNVDELGSTDSGSESFYIEDREIPADLIEMYDGIGWIPISDADEEELREEALAAADVDEEDGEQIVWPNYDVFNPTAQLFSPRQNPMEKGLYGDSPAPWEMTQQEYVASRRGASSYLSAWEQYSDLDTNDPENIRKAEEAAKEKHKESIYAALYRGDPVSEEVLADYLEFAQMQESVEEVKLSEINIDDIRKPNRVYRGMSKAEFASTVGAGQGVFSDKRCSFPGEGTCFGIHPADAVSYALGGSTDPAQTGEPVYIVEVQSDKELMFKDRDDYVKTKDVDLWVPQEYVTRVLEIDALGDDYIVRDLTGSLENPMAKMAQFVDDYTTDYMGVSESSKKDKMDEVYAICENIKNRLIEQGYSNTTYSGDTPSPYIEVAGWTTFGTLALTSYQVGGADQIEFVFRSTFPLDLFAVNEYNEYITTTDETYETAVISKVNEVVEKLEYNMSAIPALELEDDLKKLPELLAGRENEDWFANSMWFSSLITEDRYRRIVYGIYKLDADSVLEEETRSYLNEHLPRMYSISKQWHSRGGIDLPDILIEKRELTSHEPALWMHVVNIDIDDPVGFVKDFLTLSGEVCVSDPEDNFFTRRKRFFGILMHGPAVNVSDIDVYSNIDLLGRRFTAGQTGSDRTEAWVVPDQCELYGVVTDIKEFMPALQENDMYVDIDPSTLYTRETGMTFDDPEEYERWEEKAEEYISKYAQQENLPPQQGYPEMDVGQFGTRTVPEPIGYVYHVSPYAKEILEEGFVIDPTRTTLGAMGPLMSISTTTYENAVEYLEGIRLVVGVASGELDTNQLVYNMGASVIEEPIQHIMVDQFINFWRPFYGANKDSALDILPEAYMQHLERYTQEDAVLEAFIDEVNARGGPTEEDKAKYMEMHREIQMPMDSFLESDEAKKWLWSIFINDLNFTGEPLSEEDAIMRRWKVLKSSAYYTNIPAIIGYDPPEHMKSRTMADVGIVEVAVAPAEWAGENAYVETIDEQLARIERRKQSMEENPEYTQEDIDAYVEKAMSEVAEPKGQYTYTPGEKEWKFYDPTDLWPIRLVGAKEDKPTLVLDIDDTLADTSHRAHLVECDDPDWDAFFDPDEVSKDEPIEGAQEAIGDVLSHFDRVVLVTGRPESTREVTEDWLEEHFGFDYNKLYMKPSDSVEKSQEFKKKVIEDEIIPQYGNYLYFIDDDPRNLEMMNEFGFVYEAPEVWEEGFEIDSGKKIASILDEYKDLGSPYTQTSYHGTTISGLNDFFSEFELGYGDNEAIWVTPEESFAEGFASGWREDQGWQVVYKVKPHLDNVINLDMSYKWLIDELLAEFDAYEIFDLIPHLEQAGFDGWYAVGSTTGGSYTDVAAFDPDKLEIEAVKFRRGSGEYTDYMDLEDAVDFLEENENSVQEKIAMKKTSFNILATLEEEELEKIYELTYKYGWLTAMEKQNNGWLPDKAYMMKAQIESDVNTWIDLGIDGMIDTYDDWLKFHLPDGWASSVAEGVEEHSVDVPDTFRFWTSQPTAAISQDEVDAAWYNAVVAATIGDRRSYIESDQDYVIETYGESFLESLGLVAAIGAEHDQLQESYDAGAISEEEFDAKYDELTIKQRDLESTIMNHPVDIIYDQDLEDALVDWVFENTDYGSVEWFQEIGYEFGAELTPDVTEQILRDVMYPLYLANFPGLEEEVEGINAMYNRLLQVDGSNNISDKIITFQEGLTTAHHHGTMADHLLDVSPGNGARILTRMSNNPEAATWDKDLSRAMGYTPKQQEGPKETVYDPELQRHVGKESAMQHIADEWDYTKPLEKDHFQLDITPEDKQLLEALLEDSAKDSLAYKNMLYDEKFVSEDFFTAAYTALKDAKDFLEELRDEGDFAEEDHKALTEINELYKKMKKIKDDSPPLLFDPDLDFADAGEEIAELDDLFDDDELEDGILMDEFMSKSELEKALLGLGEKK